jgi:hypothetical protein
MGLGWVSCPAGAWTRIAQTPAPFGFVYVSTNSGVVGTRYREYSAALPFYLENSAQFGSFTPLVVGPTPYVELWVNPSVSTLMRVT